MTTDKNLQSVDIALTNFSDSLKPQEDFISEGKKGITKVFELLKKKSSFLVDRVFIAGSIGKHTDVISPDFDCVLFINDETPPFEKVISDFEDILLLNESSLIISGSIKSTSHSVQFILSGGFSVDLLPAANLIQNQNGLEGKALAKAQRGAVINRIKSDSKNALIFSSSLAEAQLEFMRTTDSFTHQLVRLAKYWYKSLYLGEYIYGGKTIIELIAVAAAEKEQERDHKSMLRAFIKFLDNISKIATLKLAFIEQQNGTWKATDVMERGFLCARNNFIIEPANPFNDMVEKLGRTVFEKLQKYAAITRTRFGAAMTVTNINGQPYLPFDELFEPLPKRLSDTLKFKQPANVMVTTLNNCKSLNPDMKIRNEELFKKPEMKEILKAFQIYLFSTVISVSRAKPQVIISEVQERVKQMVDENISEEGRRRSWGGSSQTHEDFDVTFTYPVAKDQTNHAIVLSAKW